MDMKLALIMVTCANVEVGDIGKGGWAQVLVSGKSWGTTRSDGVDAQCICCHYNGKVTQFGNFKLGGAPSLIIYPSLEVSELAYPLDADWMSRRWDCSRN